MTHDVVVLGGGYAGLTAARRAAARLRGAAARVTLVDATGGFVERVRLHQLAAGRDVPVVPLDRVLTGPGTRVVVARVTGIDPAGRAVHLDRAPHRLDYDTLVYALGSTADLDAVPGARDHAHAVADPDGAARLARHLAGLASGSVLVVGGGLTGIETAAELAAAHPRLRVALATADRTGGWLSPRGQRRLHHGLDRLGVRRHEHVRVGEVTARGAVVDGGDDLPADVVVWAAGFRVPDLAARAGLAVDGRGRMVVDAALRSVSHPEVFGIGDAAAAPTRGGASRMSCQTGLPMGVRAGDNAALVATGGAPRPARIRYVWQNIGLGRRDGVTQFTRGDDSPVGVVLGGRVSAAFKEAITRAAGFAARHPGPYVQVGRIARYLRPGFGGDAPRR